MGKIVEAEARVNNEGLHDILNRGENARFLGECAIGTNPVLDRRLLNTLLCEKTGGSFHVAVGHCYEMTDYMGVPVKIDNGNHETGPGGTSVHWDITVLMTEQNGGGRIVLDGETIQENGRFLDSELRILNPQK
jgi:aminopeptidase